MTDIFAQFFLKFGHVDFIVCIIIFGILFHKREYYEVALCFVCFAMIFNSLLKDFFKIPLLPHLGQGYAFPSGHMHAATIFYGYILHEVKNYKQKIALAALLCCIGFSLVHCRFHDWIDVFGAVLFAVMEITIYHLIKKDLA